MFVCRRLQEETRLCADAALWELQRKHTRYRNSSHFTTTSVRYKPFVPDMGVCSSSGDQWACNSDTSRVLNVGKPESDATASSTHSLFPSTFRHCPNTLAPTALFWYKPENVRTIRVVPGRVGLRIGQCMFGRFYFAIPFFYIRPSFLAPF